MAMKSDIVVVPGSLSSTSPFDNKKVQGLLMTINIDYKVFHSLNYLNNRAR